MRKLDNHKCKTQAIEVKLLKGIKEITKRAKIWNEELWVKTTLDSKYDSNLNGPETRSEDGEEHVNKKVITSKEDASKIYTWNKQMWNVVKRKSQVDEIKFRKKSTNKYLIN